MSLDTDGGAAIGAATPPRRPGMARLRRHHLLTAAAFVGPAILAIIVLRIAPLAQALWSTFFTPVGFGLLAEQKFSGFANYITIFTDPSFLSVLVRTLVFNVILSPVEIGISLAVSVLLTRQLFARGLWRTAVFLPSVVPMVGSAVAWGVALRSDGPVNSILAALHLPAQPFFTSTSQALASIMVIAIWVGAGHWMLFLIGGLNAVRGDLLEAAALDGAGAWRSFWSVTLPLLRRPLLFVLVADTVRNFVMFVPIQMLTNGGPQESTTLLIFEVYRRTYTFTEPNLGAAATVVLCAIMIVIVVFEFRLMGERH